MDPILRKWLMNQERAWELFAPETDIVSLQGIREDGVCRRYIAEFRCNGLIRVPGHEPEVADLFGVGIYFGDNHLRKAEPLGMCWLLGPENTFHPNIRHPIVCPGHVWTGITLKDLVYQVYSILTYQNMSLDDCLSEGAAAWARDNRHRFPIDTRPLKRR